MAHEVPQRLDWVKERAACSLAQVFKQLQLGVEEDVRGFNFLSRPSGNEEIKINLIPPNAFVVYRPNSLGNVRFFLESDHIKIETQKDKTVIVTITLSNEGRCKLRIGDDEFEQWQVRRLVLEDLFFNVFPAPPV